MTRRIASVAAKAKRNVMQMYTNVATGQQSGQGGTYALGPAVITGEGSTPATLRMSYYMPLAITWSDTATPVLRNSDTIFARGYKEIIRYETNTGAPWHHRRILFYWKNHDQSTAVLEEHRNSPVYLPDLTGPPAVVRPGYVRAFTMYSDIGSGTVRESLLNYLFRGAFGLDWSDSMIASVDTNRVQLVSDTTYRVSSGNASGVVKLRKLWYPLNHNYYYETDESGAGTNHSVIHATGTKGKGDLFVVDFFKPHSQTASTDTLSVRIQSTTYWREL